MSAKNLCVTLTIILSCDCSCSKHNGLRMIKYLKQIVKNVCPTEEARFITFGPAHIMYRNINA